MRSTDYGGSGRGLPADVHPHISPPRLFFIFVFIPQVVFTLREPSGRTFGVDKGRLQRAKLRVPLSHLCLFPCLGSPWMTAGMETLVVCGCCCCCFRSQPAAVSAHYVGYASRSLMGRIRKMIFVDLIFSPRIMGSGFGWTLHFNQRLDVSDWFQRLVFAESLAVIWGDLSYRGCRFYLPEILHSYLVVLTMLSFTSTTGSPLPFLAAFHQSDSCLPDAKLTLHTSHSLILAEKYISLRAAVVAPRFRSLQISRRPLIKPQKDVGQR